jgi:hypothetical protein
LEVDPADHQLAGDRDGVRSAPAQLLQVELTDPSYIRVGDTTEQHQLDRIQLDGC